VPYPTGLIPGLTIPVPGRNGLVCGPTIPAPGRTGLVPRSAAPLLMPMACARTVQNPGERSAERTGPAPATPAQPPALAVTTGKLLEPAAKLNR
jgi:hypothetical protein